LEIKKPQGSTVSVYHSSFVAIALVRKHGGYGREAIELRRAPLPSLNASPRTSLMDAVAASPARHVRMWR
jgi:hypothetical protein